MELKYTTLVTGIFDPCLLIVPYGIEIYGDNVEEWDKENF